MNFFEQQEKARRKTGLLVFYFFLAIFLIIVTLDLIVLGIVLYSGDYNIFDALSPSSPGNIPLSKTIPAEKIFHLMFQIALIVSPIVIAIIGIGTLIRLFTLRSGGIAVAELAGATPLAPNPSDLNEKKFMNVVEEMAIASGLPIPKLYVMQNENSINAFVAGLRPSDTVLVVTKGAITQLNRDELQGVIAHEFGHIFNSDMKISVKLIGLLAGILLLGQLGIFILRSLQIRSSRSSKKDSGGALFILLLGLGLFLVGYIGLFFGRLIKAAISRQRELLADSCSIQFTRNPFGLVGALQKISKFSDGTYLKTSHAEDISHLCFCPSLPILFADLLSTHPPLNERIKAIDPEGLYQNTPPEKTLSAPAKKSPLNVSSLQIGVFAVEQSIGNPTQAHIDFAANLLDSIPEPLLNAARDPNLVQTLYYEILTMNNPKTEQTTLLSSAIKNLDPRAVLPLVDLSIPAFKIKSPAERRAILEKLKTISLVEKPDLFEFAFFGIIGKNVEDRTPQELKPKYDNFEAVLPELTTLLSYVIATNDQSDDIQAQRFTIAAQKLTSNPLTPIKIQNIDPEKLLPALKTLNLLTPLCKEKLLHVCLEAIQDDQKISLTEAELVRGIAACLDCPIPPILFPL